ncbi:MAG: hypothetical protein KJ077_46135 [Anaerolineae bacterium]|nr:hypothetical protein [Anaerolineae bacterium]
MFQKLSQTLSSAYQAVKQRVTQAWTGVRAWVKAHQQALFLVGAALMAALTGLASWLLWRHSPAFRAAVMSLAAFVITSVALKPATVEAPTLTPVEPSPDGRVQSELVF